MIHLDPQQRQVVTAAPEIPLLVIGGAGSGKTTAALHRLASLAEASGGPALIVVPTEELASKSRALLRALRVQARVRTLDAWLGREARRVFPELSEHDSAADAKVIRFKRHPAVLEVLEEIGQLRDEPVQREDLFELWGDTALVHEIVDASGGDLTEAEARAVVAHASVQFTEVDRTEEGELVLGAEGLPLHAGTPVEDALTCDVEDLPILFALERLRGGRRRPRTVLHLLLDEAQEVAPLELALLGQAVRRGGSVTVVGDAGQQVDPSAWFGGWLASLEQLGIPDAVQLELVHNHRCPAAVVALAQAILAQQPLPPPGVGLQRLRSVDREALRAGLAAWIGASEPAVVVAPDPGSAAELYRALPHGLGLSLSVERGTPLARRAVTVPERLRGLEVERVAIAELSSWPATAAGRRALYLAVTRATRGVWLGERGAPA